MVKVHANNTALIKNPSGTHEYLYNTQLLKSYHQKKESQGKDEEKKETLPTTAASKPLPPANRAYVKKTYEGRPDGGPTTRSKSKLITAGAEIECIELINFINSQK